MDARTTIADAAPVPPLTYASATVVDLGAPTRADGPARRAV
jgi:hypothetical protein